MVKIKIDKGNVDSEIRGNLPEICTDVTMIIHCIHEQIMETDEDLGKEFKAMMPDIVSLAFGEEPEARRKQDDELIELLEACVDMAKEGYTLDDIIDHFKKEFEEDE